MLLSEYIHRHAKEILDNYYDNMNKNLAIQLHLDSIVKEAKENMIEDIDYLQLKKYFKDYLNQ